MQLLPSWTGSTLGLLGALVYGTGLLFGGFLWLATVNGETGVRDGLTAHILLSWFVVPLTAALWGLGALMPGRTAGRGLLLLGTAAVLASGGVSCAEVAMLANARPVGAWTFSLASYGTLALMAAIGGGALVVFTPVWMRAELESERLRWLSRQLELRGTVSIDAVGRALAVGPEVVRELAVDLVADGDEALRWEESTGRLSRVAHVQAQLQRLIGEVERRGRCPLAELAVEVQEPVGVVEAHLDELIAAGTLRASIDREGGEVVHMPEVSAVAMVWCGGCGGPVRPVGGGLGRCAACGREVEL